MLILLLPPVPVNIDGRKEVWPMDHAFWYVAGLVTLSSV